MWAANSAKLYGELVPLLVSMRAVKAKFPDSPNCLLNNFILIFLFPVVKKEKFVLRQAAIDISGV